METRNVRMKLSLLLLPIAILMAAVPASAVTEIFVLSNRADMISGGDALVEVVPPPPAGTTIDVDGADISGDFALRANGRYMGTVSGLAEGANVLTVTLPDTSGATITIENHPPEGPIFYGPHLQPWDCTTEREGLGAPDANCNAPALVEYFYISTSGGGYQAYDVGNPPVDVATTTTDAGNTVRHIVRQETGAIDRGIYAFAVLHDPALPQTPWQPQDGWNRKLYYTFGASCNTNYTQGSAPNVLNQTRLSQGFAVATNSLNTLGHHCSTWLSAEAAMMVKERFIEQYGRPIFTISTGGSGGAIGQYMVSNTYPGITNGLIPSQVYPDNWTSGIEVYDCLALETYWPTATIPFTILQKAAVDGKGPTNSTCAAWLATYALAGNPATGCFGETGLPATNIPYVEERDYNPATNADGCRATTQDITVNVLGRRSYDAFANTVLENTGVQYGLDALNLPITNPGKITFAQFVDLNAKVGGFDVDAVPKVERNRAAPGVTETVYRSGAITDGTGLVHNAIINLPATTNVEFHTPHHSYALKMRLLKTNGHADNFALWHNGSSGLAFSTMDAWLTAIHNAGGIDPVTGIMDPAAIVANKPAAAVDTCWDGSTALPLNAPLCADTVFGAPRTEAGLTHAHDLLECTLKDIDPADYPGALDPVTGLPMAGTAIVTALAPIFPDGVCNADAESPKKVPTTPWLSYENGPGGEPVGPPPTSSSF